jgi:hypothetical protein
MPEAAMHDEFDPDQLDTMSKLEPYLPRMYPLFAAALALYNTEYPAMVRAQHDTHATTSGIWCHLWHSFQAEFLDEPGFHFLEVRNLKVLNIKDQILIRTKKVDANGRHSNNDTAQQRAYDSQEALPRLPPEAARVVMGYQPDAAFSCVERVTVRRPRGNWVSQVVDEDAPRRWIDITPVELPFGHERPARHG